jgi:hypothetical protein
MDVNGQSPRVVLMMVDEETVDNLMYARETMEKDYKLKPKNLSDVIAVLLNYWFKGEREM